MGIILKTAFKYQIC